MNKCILHCVVISRTRMMLTALVLAMVLCHTSVFAQCIPTVNVPINVNGIVVGTATTAVGCQGDLSWAGVSGQAFNNFAGPGATFNSKIFVVGYNATNDLTLDKIYLGVHVENDADIRDNDILTLYFDANGNGSWDASDFALVYNIGPMTPPSGFDLETCNKDPVVQFYRYSPVSATDQNPWKPKDDQLSDSDDPLPDSIESKVSWDMDNINDSETGIWELEIEIDVVRLLGFRAPSSGTGFGVGAKLYIFQPGGGGGTTPLKWPDNLTTDNNPTHINPNQGNVTAANLVHPTIGNCADVVFESDAISDAQITSSQNSGSIPGKFHRGTSTDYMGPNVIPNAQNHFNAKVKFYNPSNLSDNGTVTVSNTGTVRFTIKPWNMGFLGEYIMGNVPLSFSHLNESQIAHLDWPTTKSQYENPPDARGHVQPKYDLSNSDHSCLKVELLNFPVNLNVTSDVVTRNLTYTALSTIRDTILISAVGVKPPEGKDTLEYILHANWQNIPPPQKKWSYRFPNAEKIGLRNLENGYFSIPLKAGEEKLVDIEITGGTMPVAPKKYRLSPRAGGKFLPKPSGEPSLDMGVKPGEIVTIIANDSISVDPHNDRASSNGPNGFSDPGQSKSKFLLPSGYYDPSQNIGALIGSFDNFKTAFVIGTDATFVVPEGVSKLSLAVNDRDGAYGDNTGNGFELNVVMTEPLFLPTRLLAPGNLQLGIPARPRAGSNLPELDIDVFQAIPVRGEEQKANLWQPTGYVKYAVYDSHPEEEHKPGCICGRAKASSFAFSSVITILGIAIIQLRLWRRKKSNNEKKTRGF